MKDLGPIHYCLGMEVRQNLAEDTITLSQNGYVDSILRRFGLLMANPALVSMVATLDFTRRHRRKILRKFQHLIILPRLNHFYIYPVAPDLTSHSRQSIKSFSQCTPSSTSQGCNSCDALLKRLSRNWFNLSQKGVHQISRFFFLTLTGPRKRMVAVRSPVTYLASEIPRFLGTQMQTTIANSSTEAEYLAMGASTKESIYLARLLTELDVRLEAHFITTKDLQDSLGAKLKIFGDNQGALTMTSSTKLNHKARKWYLVREHFIRDLVQFGALIVQYCDTENMPADMLTKALAILFLRRHRDFTMTSAR